MKTNAEELLRPPMNFPLARQSLEQAITWRENARWYAQRDFPATAHRARREMRNHALRAIGLLRPEIRATHPELCVLPAARYEVGYQGRVLAGFPTLEEAITWAHGLVPVWGDALDILDPEAGEVLALVA